VTTLYKLTDSNGCTRGDTQWGPGVSHSGTGEGDLCGPGWIHAYTHPLLALLMNPGHANIDNPLLWESEGEIALSDYGLKVGCRTLMTLREIPVPQITTEQRVRFGILCAKQVCDDLAWNVWADKWLSGEDRSRESASTAAARAAYTDADAAAFAAFAASAAADAAAADAAAFAADAAAAYAGKPLDFIAIAEEACK